MLINGHFIHNATGANHPYSVEVLTDVMDSLTLSEVPALEVESEQKAYEIYQDGALMPVTVNLKTSVDSLKANSYIHTGSFHYWDSGKVVSFAAVNDPVPVVVIIGGAAVLLICGINIIDELVDSCADEAARACKPNGVKKCEAKITAWSLITGCNSNCEFECWPPAPPPPPVSPPVSPPVHSPTPPTKPTGVKPVDKVTTETTSLRIKKFDLP